MTRMITRYDGICANREQCAAFVASKQGPSAKGEIVLHGMCNPPSQTTQKRVLVTQKTIQRSQHRRNVCILKFVRGERLAPAQVQRRVAHSGHCKHAHGHHISAC